MKTKLLGLTIASISATSIFASTLLEVQVNSDQTKSFTFETPNDMIGNCMEGNGNGHIGVLYRGRANESLQLNCYVPILSEDELRYAGFVTYSSFFEIFLAAPMSFKTTQYPSAVVDPRLEGFKGKITSDVSYPFGNQGRFTSVGFQLVLQCLTDNIDCNEVSIEAAAKAIGKFKSNTGSGIAKDHRDQLGGSWKDKACYPMSCSEQANPSIGLHPENHGGG